MAPEIIIHATDFSRHSSAALRFAADESKQRNCKLLIVHVSPPVEGQAVVAGVGAGTFPISGAMVMPPPEDATFGPNDLRSQLHDRLVSVVPTEVDVAVERELLEGDPAQEIVDLAERRGAAQIVMGSHGRRGLSRMLLGSVAESVVREAPCPVTIVKCDESIDDSVE